jgi:hypothetical protein
MSKIGLSLLLMLPVSISQVQVRRTSIAIDKKDYLTFERSLFTKTGKTLTFRASKQLKEPKILVAINGKPPFGTDGEIPKYALTKVFVLFKGHEYHLPTEGMYNPWFGDKLDKQFVRLTKVGDRLTIRAVFSDGAGSYLTEWQIVGNVAKRTLLTADDELVTGFFSNNQKTSR